ncbi:snRNA-activating protein complex subunit 1 [Papilio xuthus]|uniref:snRNA-activating protein complex subunit 1 n=1 Tax=Papilio xuthus TaxID=66420 RepID=A0A194QGZ6_PAPXU|nr:snRNA-activating protein complex subunit 1 [Papilio xuthus]
MSSSIYETFNLPNTNGNPICHVYIADGFQDDCESLIQKCIMKHDILEYHMFCRIWKEMNIGCLYQGRTSAAEIAELSEEVLHIAKHYMVADTTIFEESVAGLFLVYSLLNLQPYPNFASLRLVPEDIPAIQHIESVARKEKRYDVLYILASVLIKGPCQFHAAERERGMEPAIKKYLDGFKSIDSVRGVRSKGVFYRQTEELDLIRELGVITKKYSETKAQVMGTGPVDQSLQYINENLCDELTSSLKNVLNGFQDDDEDIDEDSVKTENEHVNLVEEIKMKAMKEAVNPVKHLTAIGDRKQILKKSKNITGDKEFETIDLDNKRQPSPNGNKNKKIKLNEDKTNVKNEDERDIELNMSYSDESESSESDEDITKDTGNNTIVKSLPMLLNDNFGEYEIEIIDECQTNDLNESMPNINSIDVNTTVPLTKVKKEKIKNLKKKGHLKSRLSRLGMLKVASFDK